ncbi:MFS transporter [Burkholderia vietnamiensis]|uniref:MFS transporter n=1 Tax=Burkholderia vietnamiensis TaxID=60552 RepID=UPI00075D6F53|nr:MFS transporter [Burkholderia vietnamiensis]KVF36646.1 disulfide bond formation protein DsbA [Burkholderia vietnamiensis]MBR8030732.1 MFS transporter [Burkholderia vietnamiensis]MBR8087200.1 MFS transporter [Burkholderia vietnamiensis]MCA8192784.1 MFS transporter [Burkholderia vietnamiensis]MDN7407662.1 MFS transporter [Burkholderia vietnamiensis]
MPQPSPVSPVSSVSRSRGGAGAPAAATLAVASATCSLIVLDTNVVAVSLPSIARGFHASFAEIEWVVSAYMTAFAACLLPAGGLADRFGRKRMLAAGLALFALASLGCGLAPSAAWLIAARAVKGGGAAMLLTAALAVIANRFPDGRERARAWAIWGMCMGIATALAPLIGGAITQWIGWRWVFLLNLPACALLAAGVRAAIAESRDPHATRVDAPGSLLFGAALACAIAALIGAPSHGWLTGATLGRLGLAAALSTAFVAVERRHARPMVDLALFGQPRFVGAVVAMFGYAACAQVMMTFLPLYLQNAFGMSAIDAGLGMLPFALAMIVGPSLGAKLAARMSSGGVLAGGLALIGVGNLATALLTAGADYRLVALGICVTGCGAGIMNGDTQKAIIACVPRNRTGMASGISTTTRFSAIVTAVGVLGAVLAGSTHAQLVRRLSAMPDVRAFVDARFMSSLLAGDLTQALARLPPTAARVLHDVAPAAFAAGFSTALTVSGVLALAGAAVAYWLLVQPMRDVGV